MNGLALLQPAEGKEVVLTFSEMQTLFFDHGHKFERRIYRDMDLALRQGYAHKDGSNPMRPESIASERIVFVLHNDEKRRIERGESYAKCVILKP